MPLSVARLPEEFMIKVVFESKKTTANASKRSYPFGWLQHYTGDSRLRWARTPEHSQYRYWMHYAEGTFMPLMLVSLILGKIEEAPVSCQFQ